MFRFLLAIHFLIMISWGYTESISASQGGTRTLPTPKTMASNQPPIKKSPVLILSIDGAAVRGIAQFELLRAIEDQVNAHLAKAAIGKSFKRLSITDIFDFFAGTSAGSVNVGALLIPKDYTKSNTTNYTNEPKYSLDQLHEMLPDTLEAAFSSSLFRKFRTLQVPGVGGLLGSKFTATPFEGLLQELAGKARMSDLTKPAIITSYDLRARDIMNFSTHEACRINPSGEDIVHFQPESNRDFYRTDKNVFLWQAVRASSAAPVFYKPLELTIGGKARALIDAGLFVMSPTLLAWVEAQKIYPGRRLIVISISSGTMKEAREVQTLGATAGSIPKVLQPTIETALEGQQALTDLMMRDITGITYHRLGFDVRNKDFDDRSPKNIQMLKDAAKVTIASPEFAATIRDIVNAINERKVNMAKDPTDFVPYICTAKDEFRKHMKIGDNSLDNQLKRKIVTQKLNDATEKMGILNDQGKRVVPFKESEEDKKLQAQAAANKQTCQTLLGQAKTQTLDWKNNHCDNILDQKVICQGLSNQNKDLESQRKNNKCNNVIKSKVCKDLQNKKRQYMDELQTRNCQEIRA